MLMGNIDEVILNSQFLLYQAILAEIKHGCESLISITIIRFNDTLLIG
jgi:hypothetical protein